MLYRALGNSTLKISEIAFGCMSLGNDDRDNSLLLHRAIDIGINFFDTADLYQHGDNECTVGKALRDKRYQVILATKVGNRWRPDKSGWDWCPRKDYIISAAEASLKRLQTSYIDLYQLHGGTINDPIDEVIDAFETLQQQGKIRHYGISSIRPNVIREYLVRSRITSVLVQYSLLDRRPEEECRDLIHRYGVGVLARGCIARGLLAGKPVTNYLGYHDTQVADVAATVASCSGAHRTAAQTSIRWVLQQPAVTAVVAGIRTVAQLEEVAGACTAPPLSVDEIQTLSSVVPAELYSEHR